MLTSSCAGKTARASEWNRDIRPERAEQQRKSKAESRHPIRPIPCSQARSANQQQAGSAGATFRYCSQQGPGNPTAAWCGRRIQQYFRDPGLALLRCDVERCNVFVDFVRIRAPSINARASSGRPALAAHAEEASSKTQAFLLKAEACQLLCDFRPSQQFGDIERAHVVGVPIEIQCANHSYPYSRAAEPDSISRTQSSRPRYTAACTGENPF